MVERNVRRRMVESDETDVTAAAVSRRTRDEWIAVAFEALLAGGIESLRVEPLARQLGVTKGSFYHHFENRRALHLAVLEEWERLGTLAIIEQVEAAADGPIDQLRALIAATFAPDPFNDRSESAVRSWAMTDPTAAEAAARVDDQRVRFVARLLVGAGLQRQLALRRAKLLYRVLIGEFTWRSSGGPESTRRELDELTDLVLSGRG